MIAGTRYSTIADGRLVHVLPENGGEAEQRRWRELGVKLHEEMDAAIAEASLEVPEHPDDDEHNIAVGRAVEMFAGGDVNGAISFYCAWAAANGYPGISLISRDPLQVDIGPAIGGMITELRNGEIAILTAGGWVRPGYMRAPSSLAIPTHDWGRLILPMRKRT